MGTPIAAAIPRKATPLQQSIPSDHPRSSAVPSSASRIPNAQNHARQSGMMSPPPQFNPPVEMPLRKDLASPPPSMSSSLASSSSSSSSMSPQPQSQLPPHQTAEVTALNSVVIPALEAALHRRAYNLNAMIQESAKGGRNTRYLSSSEITKLQQGHENVKRLVGRAIRLMSEVDDADARVPVGMGGGVEGFLEGFLEEVLVRVEAVEEEGDEQQI